MVHASNYRATSSIFRLPEEHQMTVFDLTISRVDSLTLSLVVLMRFWAGRLLARFPSFDTKNKPELLLYVMKRVVL